MNCVSNIYVNIYSASKIKRDACNSIHGDTGPIHTYDQNNKISKPSVYPLKYTPLWSSNIVIDCLLLSSAKKIGSLVIIINYEEKKEKSDWMWLSEGKWCRWWDVLSVKPNVYMVLLEFHEHEYFNCLI